MDFRVTFISTLPFNNGKQTRSKYKMVNRLRKAVDIIKKLVDDDIQTLTDLFILEKLIYFRKLT